MLSRWTSGFLSIAERVRGDRLDAPPSLVRLELRPHLTTSLARPLVDNRPHVDKRKHATTLSNARRTLTGPKLRSLMIEHLSHSQPRAALDLFLGHLEAPDQSHSGRTLEGLVWIFYRYRQPKLGLESIERLHSKGYQVSTRLGAKALRSSQNDIMFQPERLVRVLNWVKEGIERDRLEGKEPDEHMIETVMDVLKRMGRTDWNAQVFAAYRETVGSSKVGNPKLWAAAISAQAAGGDIKAAQLLFRDWRTSHLAQPSPSATSLPPPEQPYLALLNHFAVNSPPLPASKDPAYLLLELIKHDLLPPTTPLLNSLLRTELSRRRFSSFWGIWHAFDASNQEIARDHSTWKLASRAKLVSDESKRQRGRLHHSPLLNLSPVPYVETHSPTSRSLFSLLLSTRLSLTSRRPSLRLATSKLDPLVASPSSSSPSDPRAPQTASLLNSFLAQFLSIRDFSAAVVVLETFHVHRISPNRATHSTLVVSVVKLWEKGKLASDDPPTRPFSRPLFQHGRGGGGGGGTGLMDGGEGESVVERGTLGIDEKERRRKRRVLTGFSNVGGGGGGGVEAIEGIRKILEMRKYRVGLWRKPQMGRGSSRKEAELGADDRGEDELGLLGNEEGEAPKWMIQRELRDTSYLIELLEKCSGLEKKEWDAVLEETRRELLPARKKREDGEQGASVDEKGEGKKRKITRGVRFRKERFEGNL